jgi:hypothetical protein
MEYVPARQSSPIALADRSMMSWGANPNDQSPFARHGRSRVVDDDELLPPRFASEETVVLAW